MKFYDREEERELLENIREASLQESQMTVLFGRRRIGICHRISVYFFRGDSLKATKNPLKLQF